MALKRGVSSVRKYLLYGIAIISGVVIGLLQTNSSDNGQLFVDQWPTIGGIAHADAPPGTVGSTGATSGTISGTAGTITATGGSAGSAGSAGSGSGSGSTAGGTAGAGTGGGCTSGGSS